MCFHNSISVKADKLASRYGLKTHAIEIYEEILNERYHVNAFSNPLCYTVINSDELQAYYWGLIPFWEKTKKDADKVRTMTYNARAESIFEKPAFREPIRLRRCLIPSTGYFEYHHNDDKTTTPYFIHVRSQDIFSMAGIYDEWVDAETKELYNTFSIITTEANPLAAEIHNGGKNPQRMPLILSRENEKNWIDPDLKEEDIKELMKSYIADDMDAYPIDKNFLRMHPNNPDIIKKVELLR